MVRVAADGSRVASLGQDHTARVWDGRTGRLLFVVRSVNDQALALSADGRTLATASYDTIQLWNTESTDPPRKLPFENEVTSLAFGPDGRLYAGNDHGSLRTWSATGEMGPTIKKPLGSAVRGLVVQDDGTRVAMALGDRSVRLWEPAGDVVRMAIRPQGNDLSEPALSPDGQRVAVNIQHEGILIHDTMTGRDMARIKVPTWSTHGLAWIDEGRRLACGGRGEVLLYDAEGQPQPRRATGPGEVYAIGSSRDGRWLAAAGSAGRIALWNAEGQPLAPPTPAIQRFAWSPDGTALAIAREDGSTAILTPGEPPFPLPVPSGRTITGLGFSARHLLVADGKRLHWIDRADRTVRAVIPAPAESICVAPDGRCLLIEGPMIRFLTGPDQPPRERELDRSITAAAWHPESRTVTIAFGSTLARFDPNTFSRDQEQAVGSGDAEIRQLAWRPDGLRLAWQDGDQTTVADPSTFKPLVEWEISANHLEWRPDGQELVVADGKSVRWLTPLQPDAKQRVSLAGHPREARVSPDGKLLAILMGDGTIALLRISPEAGTNG